MGTERRKQILLGALVVVLALVVYRALTTAGAPEATSTPSGSRAAMQARNGSGAATAPEVHLEALKNDWPKPVDAERNLFRFKQKAPPSATMMRPTAPTMPDPTIAPPVPTGPPPPPAITLKFIGFFERGPGKPKIAVLSDGVGPPLYGVEGGTVAGRYRIIRIGVESIEMAYLDGRGRQTIRLTGS